MKEGSVAFRIDSTGRLPIMAQVLVVPWFGWLQAKLFLFYWAGGSVIMVI
jgi:hypothetical protein